MNVEQAILELEADVASCSGCEGCEEDRDRRIFLLEEEQILDPELRARAARVLRKLWDELEGPVLWSAVRRYATLIKEDEVETLLPLLRSPVVTTKQVGLQALAVNHHLRRGAPQAVRDAVFAVEVGPLNRTANQVLLMNVYIVLKLVGDARAMLVADRLGPEVVGLAGRIMESTYLWTEGSRG